MRVQTKIASAEMALPEQIINSDIYFKEMGLNKLYGIPDSWMSRIMGICERRVSTINTQPSELASKAALKAIKSADINPLDIDLLIFCGIEKDQSEPATAHNVQKAIGTKSQFAFDVSNACFGFFDGIEIAKAYIETGMAAKALIVTGETQAKLQKSLSNQISSQKLSTDQVKSMLGFFTLGDAGGAIILEANTSSQDSGFSFFHNSVDSSMNDHCFYKPSPNGEFRAYMDMSSILQTGMKMHKIMLERTLNKPGWTKFDWLVTHQTGKQNHSDVIGLGLAKPEHIISTYQTLGNVTSASLPVTLANLLKRKDLKKGDKIGGCFAGSGMTIGQFGYQY